MRSRTLMWALSWVLWPAFLVAGVATIAVFSLIDPGDLKVFGHALEAPRLGVYTVGFLVAWLFCALSSGLTLYTMSMPLTDPNELE